LSGSPAQIIPQEQPKGSRRGEYAKIQDAIRERFIEYMCINDATISQAAIIFGLKTTTAQSIWKRYCDTGSKILRPRGGSPPTKSSAAVSSLIRLIVDTDPDLTLKQIATTVEERLDIKMSKSTVSRILTDIGYTMKLLRLEPEARNSGEQLEARFNYAQMFMNDRPVERGHVIWVDETGFNLHLRRRCGRSTRGTRATAVVPSARGRNISVVAAMSETGLLHHQVHLGAYNSDLFSIWIQQLGQILAAADLSCCWIILDNVRFHHSAIVSAVATQLGHRLLFLPPYSPMLNPIELLFSKWKSQIKTNQMIYTQENLLAAIEEASQTISERDCQGWIRECERNLGRSLQHLELD
jgi:transposase